MKPMTPLAGLVSIVKLDILLSSSAVAFRTNVFVE